MSAVVIVAIGVLGLRSVELPGPEPLSDGDRLRIQLVQPPATHIRPGGLIDVGELVNGFQGLPPAPPAPDLWAWQPEWEDGADLPAWTDPPASPAPPWRHLVSAPTHRHPEATSPASPDRGLRFGFDAPRRDYQAEREARRLWLESVQRQTPEPPDDGAYDRARDGSDKGRLQQARIESGPDQDLGREVFTGPQ